MFGRTTLVFGDESTSVETATMNFTNSTGSEVYELVLYDFHVDPTGVDYTDFQFDGTHTRTEVLALGLDDGENTQYEFANAHGAYYLYTGDTNTRTCQGSST